MSEEIKFDHFKDINELLEHIDLWYREDDIEYTRWFGLEDLHILKIYITSLQQKVEQLEKELQTNANECKQLENIRKEAIEELSYMSTDAYVEDYDIREKHYNLLMNILSKGDNNGK